MNQPNKPHPDDQAAEGGHMLDEADIGSGMVVGTRFGWLIHDGLLS